MNNEAAVVELLEELYAILLLEYHNMNRLSGDNNTRNAAKREIVLDCIRELKGE